MLGAYGDVAQGCDDLNRTAYLRSEGMRIQELPRSTVRAVSLNQCAKQCTMKSNALDCRAFEYNAASQTCSLQSAQGQPFGPSIVVSTNDPGVAFFQQICIAMTCFGNSDIHWIKAEDFHIGIEKDVIMNGLSADECKQACTENMVGAEMFPCRAFVYSSSKQECHLTADSGVVRKVVADASVNIDDGSNVRNRVNAELSAIDAGQYFEKFCIEGPVRCMDTSFEYIPNRMLDAFDKTITVKSVNICLHMCLLANSECNSVMYLRETNECILNKKSKFSNPELFRPATNVDYFDNICDYEPGTLPSLDAPAKNAFSTDESFMSTGPNLEQALMQFEGQQKATSSFPILPSNEPVHVLVEKVKGTLETECRLDGIIINAKFEEPTTGAVFVKDHSSTCHQIFTNAVTSQLTIPFPSALDSNPSCPGVELAPNLWSFVVVVQKNNLGIPSLMTESDRIFNVTCDYSNTAVAATQQDPQQETDIFVTAKDTEQQVTKIHMAVLRNGLPVTTVALGEDLELKWTIESAPIPDAPKYGYFIDECVAERLDGLPPDPAPLRLIYQGCPDKRVRNNLMGYPIIKVEDGYRTHMKAFRFDGSRRVRIRCAINICADQCAPVICELSGTDNTTLSYGRRKKRQTVADLQNLLQKYHDAKLKGDILLDDGEEEEDVDEAQTAESSGSTLEQSVISGTYTILENDIQAAEAKGSNESKTSLPLDLGIVPVQSTDDALAPPNNASSSIVISEPTSLSSQNECVSLFGVLATIQLLSFINCIYSRHSTMTGFYDEGSSRASTLSNTGTASTEFYSGSYNNPIKNDGRCLVRDLSSPSSFMTNDSKVTENKCFRHTSFRPDHCATKNPTSELCQLDIPSQLRSPPRVGRYKV
uniref:PAN domain protein n=1 Tax=Panagrellus redivivus TaxID=6233 RepID=A0A7E4ZV77_PANRE